MLLSEFLKNSKSQTTNEVSNVTFTCIASGVPEPSLSWTINGTAINPTANSRIGSTADGQQLTVTNVKRTDSGEYRCVASNNVTTVTSNAATLTVQCNNIKDARKWSVYLNAKH